jgi:hypothetical protein
VPTLRELQDRFYRLVTAPVPVADALPAAGLGRADVDAWFLGDDRLDAVARLDVYGNMYFVRLRDVLAQIFPRLAELVGADGFHALVGDYLAACPPAHHSIDRAGARLPGFIAGHPVVDGRPWLADLAAVEWAENELHDGPDAAPLAIETLRATPPDELGDLRLGLIPCHARVRSGHDIGPIVSGAGDPPAPTPTTIAIWRPALTVKRRALGALEAPLIERVAAGLTVAELCEEVAARVGDDEAVATAFECLARWAGEGQLLARG